MSGDTKICPGIKKYVPTPRNMVQQQDKYLSQDIDFYVTPTGFLGSREVVVRIPRSMSLSLDIDLPKGQDKKKIKMR